MRVHAEAVVAAVADVPIRWRVLAVVDEPGDAVSLEAAAVLHDRAVAIGGRAHPFPALIQAAVYDVTTKAFGSRFRYGAAFLFHNLSISPMRTGVR